MKKINDANYPYFIQTKDPKKWNKPINDIDCMRIHFTTDDLKTNPNADPKIYCGMERLTIDISKKIDENICGEVTYHFRRKGMPEEKFYLVRGKTAERVRPTDSLKS